MFGDTTQLVRSLDSEPESNFKSNRIVLANVLDGRSVVLDLFLPLELGQTSLLLLKSQIVYVRDEQFTLVIFISEFLVFYDQFTMQLNKSNMVNHKWKV
jgi:hypothetical protein